MLLAIDIGNSTLVFGIFKNRALQQHWRVDTDLMKTPTSTVPPLWTCSERRGWRPST